MLVRLYCSERVRLSRGRYEQLLGNFQQHSQALIVGRGLAPALSLCWEDDLPFPLVIRALGFCWARADGDVIVL